MTNNRFDVVVVGAGPAGSMAAKAASAKGAKTLLLERDPNIGLPVRCGEAVSLNNIGRFIDIDKKWIAMEIDGLVLYSPDGTPVTVNAPDQRGVILERCLFDRYLAEIAAKHGASVQTRSSVDGLVITEDRVAGVYYSKFGKRCKVTAGVVIGSDGVESRVGRWAGLKTQIRPSDYESAYQKIISGIDFDYKNCHFYLGNDLVPGGYIWIFPKGRHTASVGIGVDVNQCDPGEAYNKLNDFIKRQFGDPAVIGEMAGGVPVALPMKTPYTNGLLLAGDAARHCNPLTGGGIATSMISGLKAGELAAEAVEQNDTSVKKLKQFNARIEGDIIKVHKRAYRIAEAVGKLSDEVMNHTAHEILAIPEQQRTLKNIFLKGLVAYPRLAVDIMRAFL